VAAAQDERMAGLDAGWPGGGTAVAVAVAAAGFASLLALRRQVARASDRHPPALQPSSMPVR
jgi:hypothetical protein